MNRRLAIAVGAVAVVALVAIGVVATRGRDSPPSTGTAHPSGAPVVPSGLDPLVEEFRTTERACIQRFNDALRAQREGSIDELELSNTIERDVLEPWRVVRAEVEAAPAHDELYATLRAYMEARQISWEAYVAALRAPDDTAARPHYETHRAQNAIAQDHAKKLGALFRAAAARSAAGSGSGAGSGAGSGSAASSASGSAASSASGSAVGSGSGSAGSAPHGR